MPALPGLLRPCCGAARGGEAEEQREEGGAAGGRGAGERSAGLDLKPGRRNGAPEDPSPLLSLLARLVPGKGTGKSAAPWAPDPDLSQVEVLCRHRLGATWLSLSRGWSKGISVESGSLLGAFLAPALGPQRPQSQVPAPIPAASFPHRKGDCIFFFF